MAGWVVAAVSQGAGAQQGGGAIVTIEKTEVTGSHIPRTDVETALPVQVIDRRDIERSGAATVVELLSTLSANVLGFTDRQSILNNDQPGLGSINLRGIGAGSTLVLLNGRRVANYAFDGSAVDVNAIPLSAVDRIEVLKDGASAIYGTDAIAGVVNFILRRDYRGIEINAGGDWTQHGGAAQRQVSLTAGGGDLAKDRFNAFVSASYQKDDTLTAAQRPFSRTGNLPDAGIDGLVPTTFPANILVARRFYNPSRASGCAPPSSIPRTPDVPLPFCGFDAVALMDTIPPVERASVFGRATLRASADHLVFAELGYSHNTLTTRVPPTPASNRVTLGNVPFFYPAGGPFYPAAFAAAYGLSGNLELSYRTVPLGQRVDEVTTFAWRAVVGAEGLAGGWTYATAFTYSRNEQSEDFRSGWVSAGAIADAMATGLINPFGPSGPEGDALLAATQVTGKSHWATGTTVQLELRGSRDVLSLPAGPLAIAVGGEARRERLENQFAPFVTSGAVMGFGGEQKDVGGSRTVASAFVESIVPIVASVEAQLAVRHDHYDDFGGTTNPKVALRWQPSKGVLLRGAWGTGFRAPTLYDLFTPQQRGEVSDPQPDDPVRCPVTQSERDCTVLFPTATGGNPNLKPETSEQFNAGIVLEPITGVSLAVDYWKIDKKRFIGTLSPETIFANFSYYEPSNIVRGPIDPAYPDLPGPIEKILLLKQNLGNVRTSGIDVSFGWRGPDTQVGRFQLTLDGTYLIDWRIQPEGLAYVSGAGRNDAVIPGPFPRWRHYAALDWTHGPWGATLSQAFQSGYEDRNIFDTEDPPPPRRVSSYEVWNLQARYTGFRNASISLGVKNLMDRAPPFTNAEMAGWDPKYADPRGRTFYARLTYAFK